MKRYMTAFLSVMLALFMLAGCAENPMLDTIAHEDILLTLPIDFLDLSQESFAKDADFLYGYDSLIVMGMAEKKSALQEMTLEQYTDLVISGNKLTDAPKKDGDRYLFTYEMPVGDGVYTYEVATFEGSTHFWIVQCYCPKADYNKHEISIAAILGSIQTQ